MIETSGSQDKAVADRIEKFGVEVFLPSRRVVRIDGGRKKVVNLPYMSGRIYVHCDGPSRRDLLVAHIPGLRRFVGDGTGKPLIIPDHDMEELIHQIDIRSEV